MALFAIANHTRNETLKQVGTFMSTTASFQEPCLMQVKKLVNIKIAMPLVRKDGPETLCKLSVTPSTVNKNLFKILKKYAINMITLFALYQVKVFRRIKISKHPAQCSHSSISRTFQSCFVYFLSFINSSLCSKASTRLILPPNSFC